jgi:hypothetical protein
MQPPAATGSRSDPVELDEESDRQILSWLYSHENCNDANNQHPTLSSTDASDQQQARISIDARVPSPCLLRC